MNGNSVTPTRDSFQRTLALQAHTIGIYSQIHILYKNSFEPKLLPPLVIKAGKLVLRKSLFHTLLVIKSYL
jgi:hypothetical protein